MRLCRLFESYATADGGSLWVSDSDSEEDVRTRREKSLKWLDAPQEDMLFHSFFAEMGFPNRFEPGTARIASGLGFGEDMSHMPEIMRLRGIVSIINDIESEAEKYDEDLNGMEMDGLEETYGTALDIQRMRMDRRIVTRRYERNPHYSIIEVKSYIQASMFARYMKKPWEPAYSQQKFDDFMQDGDNTLYFVLDKDFKDIERPDASSEPVWSASFDYSCIGMEDEKERLANYDAYGMSMILVLVGKDGRLLRCTGRYGGEFMWENWLMFLDEEELSLVLGRDFYETFV